MTMLRPSVQELLCKSESYYSLVVAVAKRAREIADEIYENGEILEEKPVKTSIEEFTNGKCRFVEDPELRHNSKDI
ncbi:MAG: DNA-directed RNA polymerase subunit omega [Oscillospiraceae bacterium]